MTVHDVGGVAIGRNEGERLRVCLESLVGQTAVTVYVDSGSTDGSLELARRLGCEVVSLDLATPFTAARARNAGVRRLGEKAPELSFVQFVDGDCELVPGWLERAAQRLAERPELGVVCGRRRERFPEASVFNRVCDIEWDTPVGPTKACGGDAMIRLSAFREVGGFDEDLIAGEEPELCIRLRQAGHGIERIDAEMTLHDAAITTVSQWYRRARRAGHAFAQGSSMHGAPPERHWVRETRRIWLLGGVVPAVAFGGALPTLGLSVSALGAYGWSAARIYASQSARGTRRRHALAYAVLTTAGRIPELHGVLEFHLHRLRGRRRGLIEYK